MPKASHLRRSPDELALALSGPLGQWLRAVEAERDRVKDEGADLVLRQADAALLAVATRNLVRTASAVAGLRKDPLLDAAIADFESTVPGARSVRNVLEHFDEYAARRRRLHRSRRITGGEHVFYERTTDRYVLYVADLAFDVDTAADAARDLAEATLKAIDRLIAHEAPKRHGDPL